MKLMNRFLVSCLVCGLAVFVVSDSMAKVEKPTDDKADCAAENGKHMGRIAKMVKAKADKLAKEKAKAEAKAAAEKEKKEVKPTSEENAVIFRIEDIKPQKNEKDLVDKCGFMVTVFNRMDKEVKEANIDFIWKDSISAKYKVKDDSVKAVDKPQEALTVVTKAITLENVPPHQQKSFEFTVDTDKCFLLLDQLEYKVNSCIAEGDKIVVRNNRRIGTGSCVGRFDYINSKNPEYYSEFKDVPESVLLQQAEEAKQAELAGIKEAYETALVHIEEIDEELDKIVEMPEEEEEVEEDEDEEEEEEDSKDKKGKKDKKAKKSGKDKNADAKKADKKQDKSK